MVSGMSRCNKCETFFSLEEKSTHICNKANNLKIDRIEYIHCIFQELENLKIGLPMGGYMLVYDILEEIREDLEWAEDTWQRLISDKE